MTSAMKRSNNNAVVTTIVSTKYFSRLPIVDFIVGQVASAVG